MEIEVGREYNIRSMNRDRDDHNYIFRGIVLGYSHGNIYDVCVTEYTATSAHTPGDEIRVSMGRFLSPVVRNNKEASTMLDKEW